MNPLTVGSLFSGIGGIDLGLERAGMRVLWHSEIDPYASRVLAKHWPAVPNHGDITQIDFRAVKPVDVIAGGFPCQDISHARTHTSGGKHESRGLAGNRSGLWFDYLRAIRDIRPRYVLVENSSALSTRGLDGVLGGLSESGYDAEWIFISASELGAPHRRERCFVVAYPHSVGRLQTGLVLGRITREAFPQAPQWQPGRAVRGPHGKATLPPAYGMDDGISRGLDDRHRITGCGNAVVPQVAELIGGWIIEHARATGYLERAA